MNRDLHWAPSWSEAAEESFALRQYLSASQSMGSSGMGDAATGLNRDSRAGTIQPGRVLNAVERW